MKHRVRTPQIAYPTDADVIARLLGGEYVPMDQRGLVVHVAGDVVDDVPACSVESLIAEGAIEEVQE